MTDSTTTMTRRLFLRDLGHGAVALAPPESKLQAPKRITVGGRPATQIDADTTVVSGTRIEFICSKDSTWWLLDHNDRWRFVEVKNADGSGVVWITNGIPAPAFGAYAEALDRLLGTFQFR